MFSFLMFFFTFVLMYSYILYPLLLLILPRSNVRIKTDIDDLSVCVVVVAHNEEKVISKTLESLLVQDYPAHLLKIVVTSDYSTDTTNSIVESYKSQGVGLYVTKERKGRANAHNEVCSEISTDIIAFCDANTIWNPNSLSKLVSAFHDPSVGYVTGQLSYVNTRESSASASEGLYWKYEVFLRKLESSIHSVTAGNGAIYAIRKICYQPIDILHSHDIAFPSMVVRKGYRSVYVPDALAYERAGETTSDEYSRKVRMFGRAWHYLFNNLWVFNPFKVGFTYSIFMVSHRLFRYSAGLLQLLIFISSILSYLVEDSVLGFLMLILQFVFYMAVILGHFSIGGRKLYTIYYFNLFHLATLVGLYRFLTNKIRPFWLSPQSTRK